MFSLNSIFMTYPTSFKKVMDAAGVYQIPKDVNQKIEIINLESVDDKYDGQDNQNSVGIGKITYTNGSMIFEGEFKGYKLNGQGRQIKIDSYYVGSFKNGLKNGNGTLTFIGNSSSFTGNWGNDKLVAECLG